MGPKRITAIVAAVVILAVGILAFDALFKKNDAQNWQFRQTISGNTEIINDAGWYWNNAATVWTYPRADRITIGQSSGEEVNENTSMDFDQVRVTFSDGGTAMCSVTVRYQLPALEGERELLHEEFGGDIAAIQQAVYQHVVNVIKATGPMMTSSEHQSSRKGEFQELVFNQSQDGIYAMRRVEQEIAITTPNVNLPEITLDADGNPVAQDPAESEQEAQTQTIEVNEIIVDPETGRPQIGQESPLTRYGITIVQLSVTDVDYDEATLQQFAAKKEAFLRAQLAQAEREEEYEQTLMVVQRGLRERAEAEAEANVELARAVIAAQRDAEVALQQKERAETEAGQRLEVARLEAETAQAEANGRLQVAELQLQIAQQEAEAITTLAAAEEERITRAGAITEETQVLAEIAAQRDVAIAQHLAPDPYS